MQMLVCRRVVGCRVVTRTRAARARARQGITGLALAAALVIVGCGGSGPSTPTPSPSGSGTGGGGTGGGSSSRTITALIDGVRVSLSAVGARSGGTGSAPASLLVSGSDFGSGGGTSLALGTPQSTGTFSIGPGSLVTANMSVIGAGSGGWLAFATQGSGTVTVSALTATGASGTFNFVMVSTTGGPSKTVTNGAFDVTF
jgi:hypothetical protein